MRLRRYAVVGVLAALLAGTSSAGGAASAEAAGGPVRAESCGAAVQGRPGTPVVLSPEAVLEPVTQLLAQLDPLGVLLRPFEQAWAGLPDITIGTVPVGQTVVAGTAVADAVLDELGQLPVLAPVIDALAPTVREVLALTCSVLVRDDSPQPGPPGAQPAPGMPPPQPGVPAPGLPDPAAPGVPQPGAPAPSSPPSPDAGIPPGYVDPNGPGGDAAAIGVPELGLPPDGIAFQYNAGGVPQFGLLGQDARNPALRNALRSSGSAVALPVEQDELRQPLVLAVLLVTLVGTQLARTWLLRRYRADAVTTAGGSRTTTP